MPGQVLVWAGSKPSVHVPSQDDYCCVPGMTPLTQRLSVSMPRSRPCAHSWPLGRKLSSCPGCSKHHQSPQTQDSKRLQRLAAASAGPPSGLRVHCLPPCMSTEQCTAAREGHLGAGALYVHEVGVKLA